MGFILGGWGNKQDAPPFVVLLLMLLTTNSSSSSTWNKYASAWSATRSETVGSSELFVSSAVLQLTKNAASIDHKNGPNRQPSRIHRAPRLKMQILKAMRWPRAKDEQTTRTLQSLEHFLVFHGRNMRSDRKIAYYTYKHKDSVIQAVHFGVKYTC